MTRSNGFTLIEVTLALVVTGLVALLSYGAIGAAADTRARLDAARTAALAELNWRGLLVEAVRGVRSPREYLAPTLVIVDDFDAEGRPKDRLGLVTSASSPPLTSGVDWRVLVGVEADRDVVARAAPLGPFPEERRIPGPPGFVGLSVEAWTSGGWTPTWRSEVELPSALRITFWDENGPVAPPMLIRIPLGDGP